VRLDRSLCHARQSLDEVLHRLAGQVNHQRDRREDDEEDQRGLGDLRAPPEDRPRHERDAEERSDHRDVIEQEMDVNGVHGYSRATRRWVEIREFVFTRRCSYRSTFRFHT
jgi:hypothetical protein